ncbi:MAG: hypothetical protein Q8L85_06865 [Alphaproteobacteria bacterium]|nr:hypothetical protein [Alphaproteobacteria bacterium]
MNKEIQERKKFTSEVNVLLLEKMYLIAAKEGRQFQAVLEEAFDLYIRSKINFFPRQIVAAHFKASIERNKKLGERLAK